VLSCSSSAGDALFGPDWKEQPNSRVLFCGIDLDPFRAIPDRSAIRATIGIPADAVVIGHTGRFVPQKNHSYFIDIALRCARLNPRSHFLLVGDGPLWAEIRQRAASSPIADRFHFLGPRSDVPVLMLAAMDAFLFPSHFEGLPLVLVEAQAAGLPCIISDVVSSETDIYPGLLRRLSLKDSPEDWAESVQNAILESTPEKKMAAFRALELSPFNITCARHELEKYYMQLLSLRHDPRKLREQPAVA
jgi:glycosyltransferase involved in cell wall biosynthesis